MSAVSTAAEAMYGGRPCVFEKRISSTTVEVCITSSTRMVRRTRSDAAGGGSVTSSAARAAGARSTNVTSVRCSSSLINSSRRLPRASSEHSKQTKYLATSSATSVEVTAGTVHVPPRAHRKLAMSAGWSPLKSEGVPCVVRAPLQRSPHRYNAHEAGRLAVRRTCASSLACQVLRRYSRDIQRDADNA